MVRSKPGDIIRLTGVCAASGHTYEYIVRVQKYKDYYENWEGETLYFKSSDPYSSSNKASETLVFSSFKYFFDNDQGKMEILDPRAAEIFYG